MTKYILLVWKGKWVQEGPNHGRDCLFDSPEEAKAWVDRACRSVADIEDGSDHVHHTTIPILFPPEPDDKI